MGFSYNFKLSNEAPLSKQCHDIGIVDFEAACRYIKNLPYGRNSDRSDFTLILKEHKGTCSTKHAFLKQIAIENSKPEIRLFMGIYNMNELNTPGISQVLKTHHLNHIPEAHTYLRIDNTLLDITRNVTSETAFETDLQFEEAILPYQIGDYKLTLHQSYLKQWILEKDILFSFEAIWAIREACISSISTP